MRYDDQLAVTLAEHAAAVYAEGHDYWRWATARGFVGASIIPRGTTQVGIAYSKDIIIVAARGSSQLGDWFGNAMTIPWGWPAVFPDGRTHFGFQMQARRVKAEFIETMRMLHTMYPQAKVYVTGHSLGGALCTYLMRFLTMAEVPAEAAYTFESPRVCTRKAGAWYDKTHGDRTFRVVMVRYGAADIVTRIPPSSWGWQHVGQPIVIRDGRRYESEAVWQAAREAHPVKPLAHWRIFSEMVCAVRAHLAADMVNDLKAQAARAKAQCDPRSETGVPS